MLQSEFPYNITVRCHNREWFELPLDEVWQILSEELAMACILYELKVHSFILMSNHFHLIASTPLANISEVLKRFLERTSKRLCERCGRVNGIWGSRNYKTILGCYHYYLNAYKYNYFNPVKAGIVKRCEDYRFSTLRAMLGAERLLVPMAEDTALLTDPEEALKWLNEWPPEEHLAAIKAALRKPQFEHVKNPMSRKPWLRETDVI